MNGPLTVILWLQKLKSLFANTLEDSHILKKMVVNHNRYPCWIQNGPFRIYTIWSNNEVSSVFPWSWLYQASNQADIDR